MNIELWQMDDLLRIVDGTLEVVGTSEDLISRVSFVSFISIDTRTLEPGALYVSIQGVSQDGHKFVGAAFEAGANAALVKRGFECPAGVKGVLIRVDDPFLALEALARGSRKRCAAKVIAVTGSAGKTGTKEALKDMLSSFGLCHASPKSFNNHWGVPLSLARMPQATDFGVFEVGMNHAGEITPLSQMIRPEVALITTVAPVHIGHFANEEEIADAKAEIFDGLIAGGTAVLPFDNPHYERLERRALEKGVSHIVRFGKDEAADACLLSGDYTVDGSQVTASILGERITFSLSQPGEHIALNFIGALAAVKVAGCDVLEAAKQLSELAPPEGRGVRTNLSIPDGGFLLIDESYNANPASMKVALKNLSHFKGKAYSRRIAILGDMLELGERSDQYHKELAPFIEGLDIDLVFCAGEKMALFYKDLSQLKQGGYGKTSDDLIDIVQKILKPNDVVMVKGSLGSRMGVIVDALKKQYSCRLN